MNRFNIISSFLLLVLFLSVNAQDSKYEDHYKKTADELANNLKARITLSDAQTSDVRDILIDYHRRVWGIKYNLVPAAREKDADGQKMKSDANRDTDNKKTDLNKETNPADQKTAKGDYNTQNNQTPEQKKDEFKGTTRDNDSVSYYAGLGRLEIENLTRADREANEDIESVLEENQRNKYLDVKIDWWDLVKDRVYNTKYHSDVSGEGEEQKNPEDQKK